MPYDQTTALNKAYSVLEVKETRAEAKGLTIKGMASTPTPDRVEDVVEPLGARFKTPMPLLWQHKNDQPVGYVTFARPTANGIPFEAFLPYVKEDGKLKERVDEAIHSVKYGLVTAVSIGFMAVKGAVERLKSGGVRYKEWDWHELSLVTIPANSEATIATIKALDEQHQRAASGSFSYDNAVIIDLPPPSAGVSASTTKGKVMKTSIAEQIGNFEAERAYKMSQIENLVTEEGPADDTLLQQREDITKEVQVIDKQVASLRNIEKLMLTATPVTDDPDTATQQRTEAGRSPIQFSKRNGFVGQDFARLAMAVMAGKGSRMDTEQLIRDNFKDTPLVLQAYKSLQGAKVYKAAVAAGTTTDSNWAAPLVNYTDLANEFIELLRPETILGRLPLVRRVPFNVRFPKLAAGATASWVDQGGAKPVSALDFDSVTLLFNKLTTIVVLTEELMRFSSPSAEMLVRDEIVAAVAQKMDVSFIDPSLSAVGTTSPASITNGATATASTGATVALITTALTTALTNAASNNVNISSGVWIMRPQTAVYLSTLRGAQDTPAFPGVALNGGNLYGFPVIVSGNMPLQTGTDSYIVFLVQREVFLADDGATRIDSSGEASLQMDGAPATGAAQLVSLWQHNMVGLKAERFVTWKRRRDAGVQVITDVYW
jgi:HK97 family phage major capsid protein/HK97 family phage prohead protease